MSKKTDNEDKICPECKGKKGIVWCDGRKYFHDECDTCDGSGKVKKK